MHCDRTPKISRTICQIYRRAVCAVSAKCMIFVDFISLMSSCGHAVAVQEHSVFAETDESIGGTASSTFVYTKSNAFRLLFYCAEGFSAHSSLEKADTSFIWEWLPQHHCIAQKQVTSSSCTQNCISRHICSGTMAYMTIRLLISHRVVSMWAQTLIPATQSGELVLHVDEHWKSRHDM